MKAFEKFENAVFFKIFAIPSERQLILVSNLTKIFFEKKFQQVRLLELSKIWAEMDRCGLRGGRLSNGKIFFIKLAQTYDEQMLKISERYLKPLLSNSKLTKFH